METKKSKWLYIEDIEKYEDDIRRSEREAIKRKNLEKARYENMQHLKAVYFFRQKLVGLLVILLSVISASSGIFYDEITGMNDCTFLLLTIPMGIGLLFTKEMCFRTKCYYKIMDNKYKEIA